MLFFLVIFSRQFYLYVDYHCFLKDNTTMPLLEPTQGDLLLNRQPGWIPDNTILSDPNFFFFRAPSGTLFLWL